MEPKEPEDDDPVEKEIPLFLSKRLENELYLFQYPLRPLNSKNDMNISKCFIKPQNQQVKLEMDINMRSSNFDADRAEMIAKEVNGAAGAKKEDKVFEDGIVNKVTFDSSKAVPDADQYAVAIYNGKEFHLTPLKGILQLRPNFSYLDKSSKRKRETAAADAESDEEEEAGPSSARQVTVKFKQPENNERKKKAIETSFKTLQKKSEEEPWIPYTWHTENSTFSEVERMKLYAENTDETGQAMNVSDSEYIRILVPEDQEQSVGQPSLPSHVMSLHALRAQPVHEQCKLLLKDAKIIQFQQLLMLLAGGEGTNADSLLKTLPKVAVLVQGNWIVKSEILYPQGTFSSVSGVPADIMCRARDYVLLLFNQNQYVERRKVSAVIRIPTEEIKEIFMGISKLRHNKGWELSLPTDQDFIAKHPEIVQRQNLMWEQRSKQLNEFLKESKEKRQRRKSKSVSENSKSEQRDCGVSSDNDSGTEKIKSPVAARKLKLNKVANNEISINERDSAKS